MKRFNADQLKEILSRPNYTLGHTAVYCAPPAGLPHPIHQRDAGEAALGENQAEAGGAGRIMVRIERRGTKLLDKDNLYGSVKYLCDGLRYENLIPADDPEAIELIVTQKKVKRGETETVVQIDYP